MSESLDVSRRTLLTATAVGAVSLCVCESADAAAPATRPAGAAPANSGPPATGDITAKPVADGWISTIKASDFPDNAFKTIAKQPIILARKGTSIVALSTKCTHKGCAVKPGPAPAAGAAPELLCPCHKAQYSLTGAVTKPPAPKPLARYKVRLSTDGIIEIDASAPVDADAAGTSVTVPA